MRTDAPRLTGRRRNATCALVALFAHAVSAPAASAQYTPRAWPPVFDFVQVVPGVYAAVEPDNSTGIVHGNTAFVVNDSDVFVLDANHTPAAARATIAQLRKVTTKPVRTLMYTHWHNDHYLGASAFAEAYPGPLRIISTDSTRDDIVRLAARVAKRGADFYLRQADTYDSTLASGHDLDGRPLTPWRRALTEDVVRAYRSYYGPVSGKAPYLIPTETFASRMTLFMTGGRELDLMAMRGDTRSDGIVFLPRERVVMTGDILVYPIPYTGGIPSSWLTALRTIRALEPLAIVPGHGPVMHDTIYLDRVIAVISAVIDQTRQAVRDGLSLEDTRKRMSVDAMRPAFTHGDPVLDDAWATFVEAVTDGAYHELKPPK